MQRPGRFAITGVAGPLLARRLLRAVEGDLPPHPSRLPVFGTARRASAKLTRRSRPPRMCGSEVRLRGEAAVGKEGGRPGARDRQTRQVSPGLPNCRRLSSPVGPGILQTQRPGFGLHFVWVPTSVTVAGAEEEHAAGRQSRPSGRSLGCRRNRVTPPHAPT